MEEEQSQNVAPQDSTPISLRMGDLLLIITTILWGSTFIITNTLTQIIPPMFYMGLRYLIGFLGFLPFLGRLKQFSRQQLKSGLIAGILCWISFATQTYGIKLTTATKSGFLTGLNVIMVPIFVAVFYHQKVKTKIWISTIIAVIGVSVLSFSPTGFERFSLGDGLILICDVFYALYIIYLEHHLSGVDTIGFSAIIVGVIAVLSFILSMIVEDYGSIFGNDAAMIFTWKHILILIYMGVIATTIATLTQTFGQTVVKSTRAAIIFALEPIFATVFAVVFGPEQLTLQVVIGGLLIMIGIYISIWKSSPSQDLVPANLK